MTYKIRFNTSVANDFYALILLVIACIFALSFGFSYVVYGSYINERKNALQKEANQIDYIFTDSIQNIENYANFIGHRIVEHGSQNLKYISFLLGGKENATPNAQNLFISTLFDWVSPDKKMLVTSDSGILAKPIDMSHREYLKNTPLNPWKLELQEPAVGIPSGQWIIPGGMGISDVNGKYLGAITMGFSIDGLAKKINAASGNYDLHFILLTKNMKYVGGTSGGHKNDDPDVFIKELSSLNQDSNIFNQTAGFLKTPIEIGEDIYPYYQQTSKYGYIILTGYSKKLPSQTFHEILLPRTLEFFILGMIVISVLFIFRKRIIEPLLNLSAMVDNISKGEKPVKMPRNNVKEIRNLAKQLINVQRYIKKIHRIEKHLLVAKTAAENANAAKSEFLLSTAHELRTPLNAIIGFSGIIHKKMLGEDVDKYSEFAGDIEQAGHELNEFIEDLLDVNQSGTGNFGLEKQEWVDIGNAVSRSIKLNISRANNAGISLNKHIEPNLPRLYTDGKRIRQILINLISNSIKYSAQNTGINISAFMRDGKMILSISDQGFGMNKEQVKLALKKWGKVGNANSSKVSSYGLGLSIVSHLTMLHGAEFIITSEPGHGTTATIIFPEERIEKKAVQQGCDAKMLSYSAS